MKISRFSTGFALLALMMSGNALADFGVGFKAGTLGLGVEGRYKPLPTFDFRVGANVYDYDDTDSYSGIEYDSTINLETFYATANLSFPLSPLRLTAGVFSNGNEVNMTSLDSATFDIGGTTYTAAEAGTLTSTTSFGSMSPYVGIGYDFEVFGKVGLNLDLGLLWQGEPEVSLVSDGLLAGQQAFIDALEVERQALEDDISDYKAWPVISLAFVYNF